MKLRELSKRQFLVFHGLFFCLSILTFLKLLPGIIGFIVLILTMIWQVELIKLFAKNRKWQSSSFVAWIFLLAYYVASLSFIYYVFGLTIWSLMVWLVINLLLPIIILKKNFKVRLGFFSSFFQDLASILNRPAQIVIMVTCVYLISYFFARPIINGSSSPWTNTMAISFVLFFIATALVLRDVIKKQVNFVILFLYSFLVISLISIRYVLSYGYDSLLHQGALQYIFENGQIDPLTPFYVGQYVLEIVIHYFSSWSFVFIERWFLPIIFLILILALGRHFLQRLKLPKSLALIPVVVLFCLPNQFIFTSPYAYSLLWAIMAIMGIYLYLEKGQKSDFNLALFSTVISLFVHPFVGLSVLVALVSARYYQKIKSVFKRLFLLIATFLASSLVVTIAFAFYNWLKDGVIILAHPIHYIYNFLSLFGSPVWYHYESPPWWLGAIYFYEKIHYFILLSIVVLAIIFIKKKRWINFFVLVVSMGALASSWLFVAGLEVSGYSYGDQINYSYRLLQVSKWFFLPLIILAFIGMFKFISKRKKSWQMVIVIGFGIVLTASWYLTYPRFDDISRMNINNIREVDYQTIDFINQREGGKNGYIVLANQIFGAAAVQKYGFNPYYPTKWGEVFYYSLPMSGELNTRFAKIMSETDFDMGVIYEIMSETGQDKVYLVTTDYWPLSESARQQATLYASGPWNINERVNIYLFEK